MSTFESRIKVQQFFFSQKNYVILCIPRGETASVFRSCHGHCGQRIGWSWYWTTLSSIWSNTIIWIFFWTTSCSGRPKIFLEKKEIIYLKVTKVFFSKFYGKVGVLFWLLFPSHLKKLHSTLRFWLEKLNCGFFHSFHWE